MAFIPIFDNQPALKGQIDAYIAHPGMDPDVFIHDLPEATWQLALRWSIVLFTCGGYPNIAKISQLVQALLLRDGIVIHAEERNLLKTIFFLDLVAVFEGEPSPVLMGCSNRACDAGHNALGIRPVEAALNSFDRDVQLLVSTVSSMIEEVTAHIHEMPIVEREYFQESIPETDRIASDYFVARLELELPEGLAAAARAKLSIPQ